MIRNSNENGSVNVSTSVYTDIAGTAASNCFGVKGMTVHSVTDGLVHLLKKEAMGKGVKIRYNSNGTISIELHIAVDRCVNLPVLCSNVMKEVRYKMESTTGVKIDTIDVFVDSIIAD